MLFDYCWEGIWNNLRGIQKHLPGVGDKFQGIRKEIHVLFIYF